MNKKYRVLLVFFLSLILLLVMFLIFNDESTDSNKKNKEKINDVAEEKEVIDYSKIINDLEKEYNNEDIVGILEFSNEKMKFPIVQGNDNEFYLTHDLDKEYSDKGSVFLDYRVDINSSKKLLVYGHSSENIYTDLNFLQDFYNKDYYEEHKYVEITTDKMKKKYEIFSVYTEVRDFSYMQTDYESNLAYLSHINELKNNSIYSTNVELDENDEILIVQTCSMNSDYSKYQDKYLLIISRRVN